AAAHRPHFLARHPHSLARPVAGALYLIADHGTGAVVRRAGARVERPATRLPAALGHDRTRAIFPLRLPAARANLVALLRPDRLVAAGLVRVLPRLDDGAIASHRVLVAMLFVNGLI